MDLLRGFHNLITYIRRKTLKMSKLNAILTSLLITFIPSSQPAFLLPFSISCPRQLLSATRASKITPPKTAPPPCATAPKPTPPPCATAPKPTPLPGAEENIGANAGDERKPARPPVAAERNIAPPKRPSPPPSTASAPKTRLSHARALDRAVSLDLTGGDITPDGGSLQTKFGVRLAWPTNAVEREAYLGLRNVPEVYCPDLLPPFPENFAPVSSVVEI